MTSPAPVDTVVLDLDGTLVDSVYVHTLAWVEALREVGLDVPSYRVHRAIGMGGDKLVEAVVGQAAENVVGNTVRDLQARSFEKRFSEVRALEGATELLEACRTAGLRVVLASSSQAELTDQLLALVDEARLIDEVVPGSAGSSKPEPDLVETALARAGSRRAFLVGDAVWDVEAAERAGIPCVGLLTGGYAEAELESAGAVAVLDTPRSLAERLGEVIDVVRAARG